MMFPLGRSVEALRANVGARVMVALVYIGRVVDLDADADADADLDAEAERPETAPM
jgi:hypothetical protein